MIKNERQYRITKAQVDTFERALADFLARNNDHMHPLLRQAHRDALQSQITDLRSQLEEYDALKAGKYNIVELDSFEKLPRVLIQARIASGLSQKDLAERLGLKEQQIQRYEATEYASASFERINEIIHALNIKVHEHVFLPGIQPTLSILLKRLKTVGIEADFIKRRLLPPALWDRLQEETKGIDVSEAVLKAVSIIARIFGWSPISILSNAPLELNQAIIGTTRYKKPARASERRTDAYTIYAHYLALLVLEATSELQKKPVPTKAVDVREQIVSTYGSISLKNVLDYVWDLGMPVLPLSGSGTFHGACWRVDGHNIIVLKQQTTSEARWLFDLLHELRHAGQDPEKDTFDLIETNVIGQGRQSKEEHIASKFAGNILLNGQAEELAQKCVAASNGSVERLKVVVPFIAAQENVSVDALANYMAFRLSLQNINWWGTAHNLQAFGPSPWQIARDVFLERVDLERLNEIDRELLLQALED